MVEDWLNCSALLRLIISLIEAFYWALFRTMWASELLVDGLVHVLAVQNHCCGEVSHVTPISGSV